jgi:uncharacterized protein YuzE
MRIQYFHDTDTLYIVFDDNIASETKELDENTLIDLDEQGNLISLTLEHAKARTNIADLSFQQIALPVPA